PEPHRVRFSAPPISPAGRHVPPTADDPLTPCPVCLSQLDLETGESIQDPGGVSLHAQILDTTLRAGVRGACTGRSTVRRATRAGRIEIAPGYCCALAHSVARDRARRGSVGFVLGGITHATCRSSRVRAQYLRRARQLGRAGRGGGVDISTFGSGAAGARRAEERRAGK